MNKRLLEQNTQNLQRSISYFLSSQHTNMPLYMSILITDCCDLSCKHCFYHYSKNGNQHRELTLDEYCRISSSMGMIMKAIFSGGEPFLRDDFHEIVNMFQRQNKVLWTSSSTNGQNTKKILYQVEKIVSNNPYHHFSLALSLDGFEEYHDNIRGKGTFQKALNSWNELKKLGKSYKNLEIYICPTINSINQEIMPDFIDWCMKELQPAFVSVLKTRQSPRDGDYLKEIDIANYRRTKCKIEEQVRNGNMGDVHQPQTYINPSLCHYVLESLMTGKRSFYCMAGYLGGFMDFNGNVGVCEVMPVIGNIRDYDYDFMSLWNAPQNIEQRKLVENGECCEACTHETEGIIPSIFFGGNSITYC